MDTRTHDITAILMALDDFRNYAAAKIEVYENALIEMRYSPVTLAVAVHEPDRDRIDHWKARILAGDDHYPGETP
jgi:hypothetical protein